MAVTENCEKIDNTEPKITLFLKIFLRDVRLFALTLSRTMVKISTKNVQDFNISVAVCWIDIKNTKFVMRRLNLRKSTL